MLNPQISIIIPAYNASKYIGTLLDSILSQQCKSCEIIVVNDGSTDATLSEVQNYCKIIPHNLLKLVNQPNGGVCSARNEGLRHANGEWIWFVDADDTFPDNSLSTVIASLSNDVDMICADYYTNPPKNNRPDIDLSEIIERAEVVKLLFSSAYDRFWGYLWSKLFRKSTIDKYGIKFMEGLYFNEDSLFIFEYLSTHECKCKIIKQPIYQYFIRPINTMAQINSPSFWKYETDLDACIIMNGLVNRFKDKTISDLVEIRTFQSFIRNKHLNKLYNNNNRDTRRRLYKKIRGVLTYHRIISIAFKQFMMRMGSAAKRICRL